MYIIFAILIFSILITVHELGHFISAKACGVQVNEFSVFMGPKLFQRVKGETTYTLRCIPIGGYCAMEGEDEDSDNPRAFTAAKSWKRALILVSGAAMNYLVGLLIVLVVYSSANYFSTTEITGFFEGCPYEAEDGLQQGDLLYAVDGHRIHLVGEVTLFLTTSTEETHDLTLLRNGKKIVLKDYPLVPVEYETENGTELKYGFYFGNYVQATLGNKLKNAWYQGIYFTRMVWVSLGSLLHGEAKLTDMSGPVGIVATVSEVGEAAPSVHEGLLDVLYIFAFIAVNLAIMNMLPIPALDGGRVFFLLTTWAIESITKKKLDPKYEGYIHGAGMALLLALMAYIMFQDIVKLFL